MNPYPLASVVVPAHNEEARLPRCLTALLELDYPRERCEVIVVNDGSTDGSAAVALRYPFRRVDQSHAGPAAARNAGVRVARGEFICFVDADCVAEKSWLRELLRGAEDEEIGCFVGEFSPERLFGAIEEYAHDRRWIHQATLLCSSPPVAATGNVAYRRSALEAAGLFDESFRTGEDSDLARRVQKRSGFRAVYRPNARVAHAHPSSVRALATRARAEGRGLAHFRLVHADDFAPRKLSSRHYRAGLARTVLGLSLLPLRVGRGMRHGLPARKALTYPLLDKLLAVERQRGVLAGMAEKTRAGDRSPVRPRAAESLDLATCSLFFLRDDALEEIVREELRALSDALAARVPGASVLILGSFSVGEGRFRSDAGRRRVESDYDLAVVTPSLAPALSRRAREEIVEILAPLPRSAGVDLSVLPGPLLERGWMTTAGRAVAGPRELGHRLENLPPPRPTNALLNANSFLARASFGSEASTHLLAKALVRGAQAFLLHTHRDAPRGRWIGLSSVRCIRERVRQQGAVLGDEALEAIDAAGEHLLGGADPFEANLTFAGELLQRIARLTASSSWQDPLKHGVWLLRRGFAARPRTDANLLCLRGFQSLADAWRRGVEPEPRALAEAEEAARRLAGRRLEASAPATALERSERLHALFADFAGFYPHGIRLPANRGAD